MAGQSANDWDARLVRGLALGGIAGEVSDALVAALGALGCEAEYGLALLARPATVPDPTPAQGDAWLRSCYALAARLVRLTTEMEVAAQSYLHALAASDAPAEAAPRDDSAVWWPEEGAIAAPGETLEMWLRRAGYSLRHVVALGLPGHCEALGEALATLLHALRTLPPGGVVARPVLAQGIETLAATFAGDLVPHHIADLDARHPGLLTGLVAVVRLTPAENSIAGDITWARGELARAEGTLHGSHNGTGRVTRPLPGLTGNLWARQIVTEWQETVARLEALRPVAHASSL